nr:hypothetical protein [Flavobacteriales bacterium]
CRIRLIGKNDISVRRSIELNGLEDCTEWIDYMPHATIISEQKSASVLLLSINNYGAEENGFFSPKATLTGKLFEYLAAQRPILMIGPEDGQAADVLSSNPIHRIVGFGQTESMYQALKSMFEQRKTLHSIVADERFSRKTLTGKMVKLFEKLG